MARPQHLEVGRLPLRIHVLATNRQRVLIICVCPTIRCRVVNKSTVDLPVELQELEFLAKEPPAVLISVVAFSDDPA